jgi:hypothetical protein
MVNYASRYPLLKTLGGIVADDVLVVSGIETQ